MAKETEPKTYRVSAEVDSELRRLAKIHGGVDKALRVILPEFEQEGSEVKFPNRARTVATPTMDKAYSPLLKPKDAKK